MKPEIVDPTDLRQRCRDAATKLRGGGWDFCVAAAEIVRDRLYLDWGFRNTQEWFEADLPAYANNYSHYLAMGKFILSLPDDAARKPWLEQDLWCVIAGQKLLKADPEALLAKLQDGATYSKIRQAVAKELPDQHEESEWRTVTFRISEPVYWLWERALNRARYEACQGSPTQDHLIECLCAALIQEPLEQPKNGIASERWYNAVHGGEVRCRECGSWDRTKLTFHHTTARSSQGHESIQVPLCLDCHERVQPRWREWLATQPDLVEQQA